jgi:predicted NUDIX family NTP pyrophosphohydrolase
VPAKRSAGLLPFRLGHGRLELFLVHPGGPFWARKDDGAWSIAKGEYTHGEEPQAAALREFAEETGLVPIGTALIDLGEVRQPGGKLVRAWAEMADHDPGALRSNSFELEWPPGSGRRQSFGEVDRAAWLDLEQARRKLLKGQLPLIDRLAAELQRRGDLPTG